MRQAASRPPTSMGSAVTRLRLLGSFAVRDGRGHEITVRSRKNRALLAILALSVDRAATRESITGLLWGDHGEEQARASLRQSLAVLRKELGSQADAIVDVRDDGMRLSQAVEVDVLEVIAAADAGGDLARIRRAAEYCRGDLLADVPLRDASFEPWLETHRASIHAAIVRLFQSWAELETGGERIEAARRLVALDGLRESSHRTLMRAYADNGDNGLAAKQYELCRTLLREQLGTEPSRETVELHRSIIGGALQPGSPPSAHSTGTIAGDLAPFDRPSIAVLPFDSAEPDQTFFAEGIAEELIANLSRFRRLSVIARASSFAFRDSATSARTIGQRLGVRFLLYGRVRRAGASIRVAAELVEGGSEAVLWVERYDRPADQIFGVIDELSASIVASTVGHLENALLRRAKRRPTSKLASYELFLRGRALMHSGERKDKLEARRLFEAAIAIDGQFAIAYAQLAFVHLSEFFWDNSGTALANAAEIALRALAIDEEEAWSHMVLGLTWLHRREFDLALKHCERSVALNPNDPELSAKLGLVLTDLGRAEEAIPLIQRAMRLNPLNPNAFSDYLALALIGAGRYKTAIEVLTPTPETSFYYFAWLTVCHAQLGDLPAARQCAQRAIDRAPEFTVARFAAMEPLRDPQAMAIWTSSMREAGIPD
jgi:TolB-like protein/DNA-binding SARP family transcriptional activator